MDVSLVSQNCMYAVNSWQLWGRNIVIYTKDFLAKRWHCGCIDFAVDEQPGRRERSHSIHVFNSAFHTLCKVLKTD